MAARVPKKSTKKKPAAKVPKKKRSAPKAKSKNSASKIEPRRSALAARPPASSVGTTARPCDSERQSKFGEESASGDGDLGSEATRRGNGRSVEIKDVGLIKSRQRVNDHGEVFTPAWMVDAMLDLVRHESERIDSRFLEPACGSGNFLIPVLKRKLAAVEARYGKNMFEKQYYALLGLMCIYGIELLDDNVQDCRANLAAVFSAYLGLSKSDDLYQAAVAVLRVNIVHGDALTITNVDGDAIVFAEWGYLGKGRFQRRDFRYDTLTQTSAFGRDGTLFANLGHHEIFEPIKNYPTSSIADIAHG